MTENETRELQSVREIIAQMRTKEKIILARIKERERKEKTRRIFQYGALIDKHFGIIDLQVLENLLIQMTAINEVINL